MPNGNEGRPLQANLIKQIRKLRLERMSVAEIASLAGVSKTTVMKYTTDISARWRAKAEVDRDLHPSTLEAFPHDFNDGVRESRLTEELSDDGSSDCS